MSEVAPTDEQNVLRKRFVPSLALAVFGTGMLDVLASLFLVDIAIAFFGSSSNSNVAAVSQIVMFSSAAALVFGILNGFLSVRFKHKSLLLFGAICIVIGTLGCYLAPNFMFMQIFYPLDGVGTIIVGSMAYALIGEYLPLAKRPKAIGWVVTAAILASAVGFPVAGFIAGIGSWRSYLLWYVLPISIAALALAFLSLPVITRGKQAPTVKVSFLDSFKQVMLKRSATACVVGSMFMTAAGVWSFFAATFWRKQFLLSVQSVALITLGVTLVYALGSLIGSRLVNRVGRKRLVASTWFLRGLLIGAIVFMPDFWTALAMSFSATFAGGFAITAGPNLSLEQAPKARGTMMSIIGVFGSLGVTLGVFAGGLALGQFGYQILGATFGLFGIIAASIIYFLANDPCRSKLKAV